MQPTIIKKPTVEIDPDLLDELNTFAQEEGQVVVHCITRASDGPMSIRVHKTTYLYDQHSSHRSELVHAENITYAPQSLPIPKGQAKHYSLIFSGLPKSCTVFDLEELNEPGTPFSAQGIHRNESDVYYVKLL